MNISNKNHISPNHSPKQTFLEKYDKTQEK